MKALTINSNVRAAALALVIALAWSGAAHAQAIIGGGGGLGIFSGVWTWFQTNMLEGIIVMGVAALAVSLMLLHFRVQMVAMICAGAVILANAVAIASGAVSVGGVLGG